MLESFIYEVDDDKIIKYKDKDGESQEMTAGAAKKMDKEHPAKIAWDKMDAKEKGGDDDVKGKKLGKGDFDTTGGMGDDNSESDNVEISDANSGPIDRDDIMDMLKNDSEIMDKLGDESDVYWDGMDLVSSKFDDVTVASIPDDASMTLGDLKKQIMDFEPEDDGEEDYEPTHAEIMQHIEDEGYGGDAIGPDGNPTPEAYEDAKQELIFLKKQNETITINGKKYKAIKEEKTLKEQYDRLFTNRTVI